MRFKAADLKKAIDGGDLAQIRRVVEQKDSNGNPTVDINNICTICPNCTEKGSQCESCCATGETCFTCSAYKERSSCPNRSAWHYTLFSELDSGKKYEILLALLAVRNSHNDPTIDLERTNGLKQTALEAVLGYTNKIQPVTKKPTSTGKNFSVAEARQLVYKIINLRTHCGSLIVNFSPKKQFIGTLNQSILLGDPEIVRMVLDLRDDDGFYAIDVNQVLHWGYNLKQTPLDIAYSGSYWQEEGDPQHVLNHKIVDLLNKAGALRYSVLQKISPEDQKKCPLERMKPNQEESKLCCEGDQLGHEKKDECSSFFENKQNIHLDQVEQTVDNSIVKLKEYYKALSLDEKEYAKTLSEIESFLETIPDENPNYSYIKKGLDFVKSCDDAVHPISGLTMAQVLILVWTGVNNAKALLEGHTEYGDIVEFRRNRFLDELQEIATTYRRGADCAATCISGARARLVKALSYLHPGVFISHTKEEAIELFLTRLDILQTAAIATYTYEEKRTILASWSQLAEVQPGEESKPVPAYQFMQKTYPKIKEELESEFKNSVDQMIIDDAMANCPMPIVHKALNALIQQINALVPNKLSSQPLKKIQEHTQNVFIEKHQTFDEAYKWLNEQYQDYQLLKQLIDKIKVFAIDRNDAKQIESHLKKLKFSFQMLWRALPDNDVNTSDVDQVNRIINEFSKDTDALAIIVKLEEVLSALEKNKKIAKFIKDKLPSIFAHLAFFKLEPEKKENPIYKKLVGKLTEKIDLYDHNFSFKKNHGLLQEHYQSYNELMGLAKKIEAIEHKGNNFFTKLTTQLQEKIYAINVDGSFLENYQTLNRYYQFYEKMVALHTRMAAISRKHPVFPLAHLEQHMLNHVDDIDQDGFLTVCSHKIDYFEEISSYMATNITPIYLTNCLEKNIDDYAKSEKKEIKLNRAEAKELTGRLEKMVQIDNAVVTLTEYVDKWDAKDENQAKAIREVGALASQMRESIALSMKKEQFDSKNFVTELNAHITEAKPVLETHRGMKDAFAYFMLSVLTAGIALLFLTGRKAWHWYHHTPNFVFFPPLTDTELIKKTAPLIALVDRFSP